MFWSMAERHGMLRLEWRIFGYQFCIVELADNLDTSE